MNHEGYYNWQKCCLIYVFRRAIRLAALAVWPREYASYEVCTSYEVVTAAFSAYSSFGGS